MEKIVLAPKTLHSKYMPNNGWMLQKGQWGREAQGTVTVEQIIISIKSSGHSTSAAQPYLFLDWEGMGVFCSFSLYPVWLLGEKLEGESK